MDMGVLEEVEKQLKDNPHLARMLVEEQKKMQAQVTHIVLLAQPIIMFS